MELLTCTEKQRIRNSPCARCGAVPPFEDGSWCHVHRLNPDKGYTKKNTVPRCPRCHDIEHGSTGRSLKCSLAGKRSGQVRRNKTKHDQEYRQRLRKQTEEAGRIGGRGRSDTSKKKSEAMRAIWAARSKEERSCIGRKTAKERQARHTVEELGNRIRAGQLRLTTPEQRSERARNAALVLAEQRKK